MGRRVDPRCVIFHHTEYVLYAARSLHDLADEEGESLRPDYPGHRFGRRMARLNRPHDMGCGRIRDIQGHGRPSVAREGISHRAPQHQEGYGHNTQSPRIDQGRDQLHRLARAVLSQMDADRRHLAVGGHGHQRPLCRRPQRLRADGRHTRSTKGSRPSQG